MSLSPTIGEPAAGLRPPPGIGQPFGQRPPPDIGQPFGQRPLLGIGRVIHQRLRPVPHRLDVPTWFVLLPLRSLRAAPDATLRRNRRGWVSFHDADHGDGRADCLQWLDEHLQRAGVADADGEVWLHTYPRVLGFVFNPVSFWYCHRADGSLAAIVAEVNNTFGGRHCYLLAGPTLAYGAEQRADKAFHVSPFCQVEGGYRFRFLRSGPALTLGDDPAACNRSLARIDYDDASGPLITTAISGELAALTPARLRLALRQWPLLTLGVVARIHWHALRLLLKRVPFFGTAPARPGPQPH